MPSTVDPERRVGVTRRRRTADPTTATLRLGTRASQLARTQSQAVADAITAATGTPVELVHIITEGDRSSAAIAQLGGTGVFVTALRDALLEGERRPRRAQLQGPAHRAGAGPDPRRRPAARGPARRARRPRRAHPRRAAGRLDGRHRRPAPGRPAARARARAWTSSRSAATSTPGWAGSPPGDLDAVVLARAGLARLGRLDGDHRDPRPAAGAACARAGRARRRVPHRRRPHPRAARPARGPRRPGLRRRRARARSPRSRPAAARRWPPTPSSPRARTAPSCSSAPRSPRSTAATPSAARSPDRLPTAAALGRALAAELLDRGAAELMAVSR